MNTTRQAQAQAAAARVRRQAADAYGDRAANVSRLMLAIDKAQKRHAEKAAAASANWGFVGDLAAVEEQLAEALRMLGGEDI